MRVYVDVFTKAQVISDSFPWNQVHDGVAFEVNSKFVKKEQEYIEIGRGEAFAHYQPGEDDSEDQSKIVVDVVDSFNYVQVKMTPEEFLNHMKAYLKKVEDYVQKYRNDRLEKFKKGSVSLMNQLTANVQDMKFYVPDSKKMDGAVIPAYKKEGKNNWTFLYVADGLEVHKV